jgi:g-D-glutamyl-meso-diaminopimelate peptidase
MQDIVNTKIPFDYKNMCSTITKIADAYDEATLFSIGKSWLKRELYCLKIGNGDPAVFYCGTHHSLEWITGLLLMKFAEDLLISAKEGKELGGINAKYLLDNRSIYILPMVNPDGTELVINGSKNAKISSKLQKISHNNFSNWQANARGVDINHNYDAGWKILRGLELLSGITGPAATRYGGKYAESEKETKAVCALCRRIKFKQAIAFHSQGEVIYWDYGEKTPEFSKVMAVIIAKASGYELDTPAVLASHGGFKDWFIDEFDRPAFTVEVGQGKNPLDITEFDSIYNKLIGLLMLGCII